MAAHAQVDLPGELSMLGALRELVAQGNSFPRLPEVGRAGGPTYCPRSRRGPLFWHARRGSPCVCVD